MRIGLEDHSYISFRRVNQSANEGKIGFNVSPSVLSASSSTITVNGGATFSDKIYINAASSSTEVLIVDGSVNLSGNLLIDGGVAVSGNVSVANTLTTFNIVPASTATYNIGQPDRYFDRIYVRHLGTVTDNSLMLYGYASYASTLTTTRVFKVEGDVESSSEDFNGSQNVTFVVSATSDLILNKPVSTLTTITQTLLVVNTATPVSYTHLTLPTI